MSLDRWVFALPLAATFGFASTAAFADNVSLDNIHVSAKDGQDTVIQHIDVTDTNLTADEVRKLLATDTTKDDRASILAKMKAARVAIPSVVTTQKTSTFTLRDLSADGIDSGKAAHAKIGSVEASGQDDSGQPGSVKTGALTLDGWDFGGLLTALRSGSPASGLGRLDHMNFAGFDATFATDSKPGAPSWHVTLASLDAKAAYAGTVPTTGQAELKGLVVEPPKGSAEAQQFAAFGYDKVELGMTVAGTYDPAAKTYALTDFTFNAPKAGALTIKGDFGGIPPEAFNGGDQSTKMAALMSASISDLQLRYADAGLLDKGAAFTAKAQKKTGDALRREWAGMATQFVPMLLGGDPSSLKVAGALNTFISKGGTLAITVKAKTGAVKVMDLIGIRSPQEALAVVDVDAQAGP